MSQIGLEAGDCCLTERSLSHGNWVGLGLDHLAAAPPAWHWLRHSNPAIYDAAMAGAFDLGGCRRLLREGVSHHPEVMVMFSSWLGLATPHEAARLRGGSRHADVLRSIPWPRSGLHRYFQGRSTVALTPSILSKDDPSHLSTRSSWVRQI